MDNVWFSRRLLSDADATCAELVAWVGREHPDGAVLGNAREQEAQWLGTVMVDVASQRVLSVHVDDGLAPRAPGSWYAGQPEPKASPPAMNLVAFESGHLADGAVVGSDEFVAMPVRSAGQVAAVRYVKGTGQVHQEYVSPPHRRRGIATKLLITAGPYAVGSGWPRVWGGGEVRCSFPEAARGTPEQDQLVTVDAGAVHETHVRSNPEGEAPTWVPGSSSLPVN